ncbi:hypothetical protein BJP40_02610 [Streptomyces sp. CC53]|uniref:hypothetical protein n=1 Tax=Streptomyces sp. CC53 TaxID=1906740 RepID=UPI0008DE0224|nr:hypothetical protein [Streptomyces sp. CC53]OII63790.1 hypothetical protein BJP40_02610 [Streptomyces sp. CC53]
MQPTQQPSEDARAVLLAIADRLTSVRPHMQISELTRRGLAFTFAAAEHAIGEGADNLHAEVITHMPRITGPVTRAEYARHLLDAAGA